MGKWTPCKRRDFIHRLQQLGFDGPFSGVRHQFLVYKLQRLAIPSNAEYSVPQLRMMIREIEEILGREVKLSTHRVGLPGKVISFYIVPLEPTYKAGLAGHVPATVEEWDRL